MKVFKIMVLMALISCSSQVKNIEVIETNISDDVVDREIEIIEQTYLISKFEMKSQKKFDYLIDESRDSLIQYSLGTNSEIRFITKFLFVSNKSKISFVYSATGDTLDINQTKFDSITKVILSEYGW